jgi:cytochrome c biogenesis protein CcdA
MPYALSFLAGLLTAISPCVLPALPLIVGSAVQEHKHAPLFVALGMILSFTLVGVLLATSGSALGIAPDIVRDIAAIIIVGFGLVMMSKRLQEYLQMILTPIANVASNKLTTGKFKGLHGQCNLGILLGVVWSPCVGPTLGSAVGLASQGESLIQATTMMLLFGIGSTIPLVFIAYGSRKLFLTNRGRLLSFGRYAKPTMGLILVLVGFSILFGLDKTVEAGLLNTLPDSWVDLISRY